MGDRMINCGTADQLIYSRRVLDKKKWAETFNIGLNEKGKLLVSHVCRQPLPIKSRPLHVFTRHALAVRQLQRPRRVP